MAEAVSTDILIVGAGPVGMTLALALQAGNADLRTALVQAKWATVRPDFSTAIPARSRVSPFGPQRPMPVNTT